ncbi:uncharacterized protein LOC107359863 [Tetranychus urticae]|uniref:FZ domain-containing protein n=1 Tax=Tetranychus urticae TaxID=32264 RepID=T1JRJ2_TETUR|nr:uncharacterized protein LOC107359863 [Tetranychus urticae]
MVSSVNQLTVLVTLLSIVLFNLIVVSTAYPVDCSKFVFAPTCRGVIAKRINSNGFKTNSKSTQNDLTDRSDPWPEMNPSSSSYKNIISKLFPSMVKEMHPSNTNSGWDRFDSLYQGNDGLLFGS